MDTAGYVHFQNSSGTLTFEHACRDQRPGTVETINRCESSQSPWMTGWVMTYEPEAWLCPTDSINSGASSLFPQRRGNILCCKASQDRAEIVDFGRRSKKTHVAVATWWLAGILHGRKALANFSHFSLTFPLTQLFAPSVSSGAGVGARRRLHTFKWPSVVTRVQDYPGARSP